jgi:hypothetical protein
LSRGWHPTPPNPLYVLFRATRKYYHSSYSEDTLGEVNEQVTGLNGKRFGKFYYVLQGDVPFAALNPAYVIAMQPGPLCQFFL